MRLLEEKRRAGGTIDSRLAQTFDSATGRSKLTSKLDKNDIEKYVINPVMKIDDGSSGGTGHNSEHSSSLSSEENAYKLNRGKSLIKPDDQKPKKKVVTIAEPKKKAVTIVEPKKEPEKTKLKPYPQKIMENETIEESLDSHYATWKIGTTYERQATQRKVA